MRKPQTFTDAQYEAIMQRVYAASGVQTQSALAEVLGVRQPSISDARKRKSIPAEWLLTLLRLRGVNPDWVLTGEGPHRLSTGQGDPSCKHGGCAFFRPRGTVRNETRHSETLQGVAS